MASFLDNIFGSTNVSAPGASATGSAFDDLNFGNLGGAVQDIFGGVGDLAEAGGYTKAASLAQQNAEYAKLSTQIQETQANRALFQNLGAASATAAGHGLTLGGSAGDILRSSAEQGALQKQVIRTQGAIQENAFAEQADAYQQMASTAKSAAGGSFLGGLLKGAGAVFGLF